MIGEVRRHLTQKKTTQHLLETNSSTRMLNYFNIMCLIPFSKCTINKICNAVVLKTAKFSSTFIPRISPSPRMPQRCITLLSYHVAFKTVFLNVFLFMSQASRHNCLCTALHICFCSLFPFLILMKRRQFGAITGFIFPTKRNSAFCQQGKGREPFSSAHLLPTTL